jgi:Na+/proline symporter
MKNNQTMLLSSESGQMASKLADLVENVLNNKTVILTILVFAVVLLVVYGVHRMSVDYAWYMAIGAGAVLNVVLFLLGALIMQIRVPIISLILGTIVSVLIALIVEFFVFSVDYSRTEYAQFEDDEYYYYVKAVPKMSIAIPEKKVKKISSGKQSSSGRRSSRKKR